MNNFVRQEMIKDEVIENVVVGSIPDMNVVGSILHDVVVGSIPEKDVDESIPEKRRKQKGWKEQKRKDTRRGRPDGHKKEGDVKCRKESCDEVFQSTRWMMVHMVKKHPKECTTPERLRYEDNRTDTVDCFGCEKPISKANLAKHKKKCPGLLKQPRG